MGQGGACPRPFWHPQTSEREKSVMEMRANAHNLKPLFHRNVNLFALGPRVGLGLGLRWACTFHVVCVHFLELGM